MLLTLYKFVGYILHKFAGECKVDKYGESSWNSAFQTCLLIFNWFQTDNDLKRSSVVTSTKQISQYKNADPSLRTEMELLPHQSYAKIYEKCKTLKV